MRHAGERVRSIGLHDIQREIPLAQAAGSENRRPVQFLHVCGAIRSVNLRAISAPSASNAVAVTTAVCSEALMSVTTVLYPPPMTK